MGTNSSKQTAPIETPAQFVARTLKQREAYEEDLRQRGILAYQDQNKALKSVPAPQRDLRLEFETIKATLTYIQTLLEPYGYQPDER